MAICKQCSDDISPKRAALGYRLCKVCGDKQARARQYCVAPINKSNYMLITHTKQLAQLNPKRSDWQ